MNELYYGDNLDVLRRYVAAESVDLIYLDPPFNSRQDYNVLFAEKDGKESSSQIHAFEDTWEWNIEAEEAYLETMEKGGRVADALRSFRTFLGGSDMLAYLAMMAPRLIELRRVLKEAGSIYLHCDPTASHYLKVLMDGVFGPQSFRNEIVWRRSHPKGLAFTRFARNHDVILSYSKGERPTWNRSYTAHDPGRADLQYTLRDEEGRAYQLTSLLNPNPNRPNLTYEFLGVTKVWRWTKKRMLAEFEQGRIVVREADRASRVTRGTWTSRREFPSATSGTILKSPPVLKSWVIRRKSRRLCWSASSKRVPMRAIWFLTLSAAAARLSK